MELGQVLLGNNDDYNYTPKKKLPLPTIFETIIFLSEKNKKQVLTHWEFSLRASLGGLPVVWWEATVMWLVCGGSSNNNNNNNKKKETFQSPKRKPLSTRNKALSKHYCSLISKAIQLNSWMSIVQAENLSLVATVATCKGGLGMAPVKVYIKVGPKTRYKRGDMGPAIRAVILSSNSTTRWWLVYQPIWKNISQIGSFPQGKKMKPPPKTQYIKVQALG